MTGSEPSPIVVGTGQFRLTEIPPLAIWRKGGNPMKKSMKDEIKGKFHEVKGSVKEKAGKVTNNPDLKAEGHTEKLRGKVQKKLGQMEHVLDK
jgi:uncharacterized protein YjbJ (UPF0337 family)